MTGINRRQLLGWLTATPLLLNAALLQAGQAPLLRFASAARNLRGQYTLGIFDAGGQQLAQHELPSRAHQVLVDHQRGWLFTIARRPGAYIDIYDYQRLKPVTRLTTQPGYHLQGHAQLSADGRYLYTSEQHPADDHGRLVIRDLLQDFLPVDELSTAGIEPHEFQWLPDGKTLVIANGGIKTKGRIKLNLPEMQPSLVYLDSQTGQVLAQHQLAAEFHQCSVRHLDVAADGQVVVALQYEGHPADQVPLVLAHRLDEDQLYSLPIPERVRSQLRQYCGSACFDVTGDFAAISSPRGGQVMLWDMQQRKMISSLYVADGCGLAPTKNKGEFMVSSGQGYVYRMNALSGTRQQLQAPHAETLLWDNHLTSIHG